MEVKMNIQVTGRNLKVGKSLISYVEDQLSQVSDKYLLRPVKARITFSREKYEFKCEASLHLSNGLTANCAGTADQIYTCYQKSIIRLDKILRRHKRKTKNHHAIKVDYDF